VKYNFTESGIALPKNRYSKQCKSDKDSKILASLNKIVSIICLFFKQKSSHKSTGLPQSYKGFYTFFNNKLFFENSLHEYFADCFPAQSSIKNFKSVTDLIPNSDSIMNNLSLSSNSTDKKNSFFKLRWPNNHSCHNPSHSNQVDEPP
jgi:hypothetical protein